MNYLVTFLAHHHFDNICLLSNDFEKDYSEIKQNTDVKRIVNSSNQLDKADILLVHNYFPKNDLYELLKTTKYDYVLLYYKKGELDYFKAWESLRCNNNHIRIILEKEERKRDILLWNKNEESDFELSVIFPVYNVGKYIKQCIETVTQWEAPYVEYIFVSDGSKDDSVDIIKEAMKNDSRIKLIEKENGGCASARQAGLDVAKGRYIGFIDPDDFVDPSMFEKLLKRALLGDIDIVLCGYNEFYNSTGKHKAISDNIKFPNTEGLYTRNDIDPLIAYMRVAIWRGIYKKQMLIDNNIHFYLDLPRFDDLPFKVETMAVANKVATVDEYLYFYRLEREGQDVGSNDKKLFVHFDIFRHLDEFFENRSDIQKKFYKIVQRDTHNWALSKLDKKYIKEYKELMKED